ncbi:MAG: phosphatase PAP2 family protein [Firmicutes bacterium]|nr:phosphatase PAP2 family protein [Bacillota bacterium]
MEKIKETIPQYKHAALLLYVVIYVPWFSWLESWVPSQDPTPLYCFLDDMIPFCEWFIIPYYMWFAYIAAGYVFLFFTSQEDFVRMCIFLYTGMTICLIIYTLWPNCQELRVDYDTLGRSNMMIDAVIALQGFDTADNVFPSIHCFNSIGMHIALAKSQHLGRHRNLITGASFVLIVLIFISTVCLKQHSILDFFGSLALAVPMYLLAYKTKLKRFHFNS